MDKLDIQVKQRLLPPNTLDPADLQNCLEQWLQSSQEGGKSTSQAKSTGACPKDRGGMGQSGGNQSSSLHRGSSHSHSGSSSHTGSPRPPPSSTVTSGALATSYAQVAAKGAKVPLDQGRRLADHDRSRDHKVCYLLTEVHWGSYVYCCFLLGYS